ncbi:unnamed protein product [Prorocentrum cordatum]|uniref:Uncharacterized protein n=1 Tax=Prorocentrum cordatum TaxID=2364126 RepID=A0ABN9V0A5_9DINO|nr:unnamed protein product [Polarella glacialis]
MASARLFAAGLRGTRLAAPLAAAALSAPGRPRPAHACGGGPKTDRSRVTFDMCGQIILGKNMDAASDFHPKGQQRPRQERSPHTRSRSGSPPEGCQLVDPNHVFCIITRAVGAEGEQGRAPKGNMVWKVGQK